MGLKCLLVDDEPPALKILEQYISMVDQLEIVGSCNNAFQAMDMLQKNKIDVVFLDIQMPKLTGISFLKTLPHPPNVIFTTAYKDYASDAFDLDAVDYLVKPFSVERFLKAVNKIIRVNTKPALEESPAAPADAGFLYFRSERKMIKVFFEEMLYIESIKDYIKIYRASDKPLLVKQSIGTLEAMLPAHRFTRVHRSFIVSIVKVTAFTSQDIEIGRIEIPIGRQYSAGLKGIFPCG
ncbi:MAG TPA: LytTR family DNA-binding domain-containing protein [Puia sp.]|nr:LytTR family DNA-binding domain-containing protein [Puia sp.]